MSTGSSPENTHPDDVTLPSDKELRVNCQLLAAEVGELRDALVEMRGRNVRLRSALRAQERKVTSPEAQLAQEQAEKAALVEALAEIVQHMATFHDECVWAADATALLSTLRCSAQGGPR